jgi:hypothetical protein
MFHSYLFSHKIFAVKKPHSRLHESQELCIIVPTFSFRATKAKNLRTPRRFFRHRIVTHIRYVVGVKQIETTNDANSTNQEVMGDVWIRPERLNPVLIRKIRQIRGSDLAWLRLNEVT